MVSSGPSHGAPALPRAGPSGHPTQHSKSGNPLDMAQFSNAKIPFASNTNSSSKPAHKTPARHGPVSAKASPHYVDGEKIDLPEIATDSEDDDDDFSVADWVNSPDLRNLLEQQQSIDPETVFGPIAPLHMEEIFKNKDRHHRFRARTSSANWTGQDRLTAEDILKDNEAREKLIANGGWSYGMSQQ
jgi:Inner centromere protein, ARK binding region